MVYRKGFAGSLRTVATAAVALALTAAMIPAVALAAPSEGVVGEMTAQAASGWTKIGTCEWQVDSSGCLVIRPENGASSGAFEHGYDENGESLNPWKNRADIKSLRVEGDVTSTHSGYLFANLPNLETVDIAALKIKGDINYMFLDCKSLKSVDLRGYDAQSGTQAIGTFEGCTSLRSVNMGGLRFNQYYTEMVGMFSGCESLVDLVMPAYVPRVPWIEGMFKDCKSLQSIDLTCFGNSSFASEDTFNGCASLRTITVNPDISTEPAAEKGTFAGCTSLVGGNGTKWSASHTDGSYARVDAPGSPGYFTAKGQQQAPAERPLVSSVSLPRASYAYTGAAIEPEPAVYAGGTLLSPGDYTVSYANNREVGTATVTAEGRGAYAGSASATFEIVAAGAPAPVQAMHRLYNPNSGEHFYTASAAERDLLVSVGWRYEGEAWSAPAQGDPVFRLYNPNTGDHHYTTSAFERDSLAAVGWNDEGVAWYSDPARGRPLYRLYNPNVEAGSHHYTLSEAERDMLVSAGWRAEGVGWYGAA